MKKVITIAREFGSGGHEIGKRLARRLGIDFYDKELISLTASQSHFSEGFLRENEEQAPGPMFDTAIMGRLPIFYQQPISSELFIEQAKVIRQLGEKGACVIVGRCADYILRELEHASIFLHAPIESRVSRKLALLPAAERITRPEMEKQIRQVDRQRAKFYEYYTHGKWGDARNYHLGLCTSMTGIDGAVDTIAEFVSNLGRSDILPDEKQ